MPLMLFALAISCWEYATIVVGDDDVVDHIGRTRQGVVERRRDPTDEARETASALPACSNPTSLTEQDAIAALPQNQSVDKRQELLRLKSVLLQLGQHTPTHCFAHESCSVRYCCAWSA